VLAAAVTVIEVALIVSLMLAGGPATSALARDTVFATVMIILNGIVGLCLLLGGSRFGEQNFKQHGVSASLATLAAIVVLTLVLPNYTTTLVGPVYSPSQLGFVAIVSLILYGTFVFVQTVRHRDYFLPEEGAGSEEVHAAPPTNRVALISATLLFIGLGAVILIAKAISPMSRRQWKRSVPLRHWLASSLPPLCFCRNVWPRYVQRAPTAFRRVSIWPWALPWPASAFPFRL
jgi:Ca2+:H+ antiporter